MTKKRKYFETSEENIKIKIKTKQNVYFKNKTFFEWEIYVWYYSFDQEKVEVLKNTHFYKTWKILISNI